MEDLLYPGPGEDDLHSNMTEEKLNECCEKRVTELKNILDSIKEKNRAELESVKSEFDLRLRELVCTSCKRNNLMFNEEPRENQQSLSLDEYLTEKMNHIAVNYPPSEAAKDLELKVYQIKEEVRKDYESELERIREEIVVRELKRKDEEIERVKSQLNEAHKFEMEQLWQRLDELASKEVENSVIRVKNEVHLSQELQEKAKLTEQLKNDKKELLAQQRALVEQKQKELDQLKTDLIRAHKKKEENMKQAFEIELKTRLETVLEERAEIEEKYRKQIEKLQEDLETVQSDSDDCQECQKRDIQQLREIIHKDILRTLELQIKAMVESGDEGESKSQWPPELAALERQFTAKYQQKLAQLVEEHALEIADIKASYEAKLSDFVKEYEIKQAEEMAPASYTTGDQDLAKIIRERDNLQYLALTLRQVVRELAGYLTSCEDELNRSIVGELLKLASPHKSTKVQISTLEDSSSGSEVEVVEQERSVQRRVHFAPDVSSIVSLMDEDCLFDCLDGSVDVSIHLRSELQNCLERLRDEAAAVLGLTQARNRSLPSTVEDRRLSSVTRQLVEEKKAKEEANSKLQQLQEMVEKLEKELHDVNRELTETKDCMVKENTAVESEFSEKLKEKGLSKLCLLQEKARALVGEKGDCPPQWASLLEELCVEGDALIEEAWRSRDELQMEVEAADKQLRSTRAFLEEQALEREQERDEFTREIKRLTELLRERDRDWTSHRQFISEQAESPRVGAENVQIATCISPETVEALEQQVRETMELLKETEEKKGVVEKELKTAVEKIWVLRDIISDLEVQVSNRAQHEVDLEHRVADLETELESQTRKQTDMMSELQEMRDCSGDHALQEELSSLHEQLQKQRHNSPAVVKRIKSQLKSMARALGKQIKELEAVNIHVSSASLSSPSEDVSIREQLEALRCATPEEKGSPPSPLAIEEMSQLSDQLLRYSRAAENIIKKLRDREMEIVMLRGQCEELQSERDILQGQSDRQLMQLAALNNRVEELRVRNERDIQANAAPLHHRIQELESHISEMTTQLKDSQRKLNKIKQKLDRSEALVLSHEEEISSLSEHQQELISKLTSDLENMRAEKTQLQAVVEKYRSEDNVSFPQLIELMLEEKNADIDQLQQRVEELQSQEHKSQSHQSKSRNYRVSFADDVSQSQMAKDDGVRDAPNNGSSIKHFFSTPLSSLEDGSNGLLPRIIGEEISKIPEPVDCGLTSSPNRVVQLESVLSQFKSELEYKTRRLVECEALLEELPILKQDLTNANKELLSTTKAVSADKEFYEERLKALGQAKQLLREREEELQELREVLTQREEEHVKTTADLKAVHLIMEGLQQKLQEAQTLSEKDVVARTRLHELIQSNDKYKDECDSYKNTVVSLEDKLSQTKKALENEKRDNKNLQKVIEELGSCKQEILSELMDTKLKCKSIQEELEMALNSAEANRSKVEALSLDLEATLKENKQLSTNCQRLKKELEKLSRKQKDELKNMLRRDSDEVTKDKEELQSLKSSNFELQSKCGELEQNLREAGNNLELLRELNKKDEKIQDLVEELKQLEGNNEFLRCEKFKTEQDLSTKILDLKTHINDLNQNIVSLETESKDEHENVYNKEYSDNLARKHKIAKRECYRLQRAKREVEKKCVVLKDELAKEKQYCALLQNQCLEKRNSKLEITKANIVDIRSERIQPASSLDNLTDQVQQELNTSARLDESLISGLENTKPVEVARSESMPQRLDYLTSRLAQVETALHVEKVVVSDLRARIVQEHSRYMQERLRTDELQREVASLQMLNDQFEDKFKTVAYQLQEQVNEIKDLRLNMGPTDYDSLQKQKWKKIAEENQRRVDELLQERELNKHQLLYLREELAKLWSEKGANKDLQRGHGHGDHVRGSALESVQQELESRSKELQQEQKRSVSLQQMLDQANQNTDQLNHRLAENTVHNKALQSKIEELKRHLSEEETLKRSLEAKIKSMEMSERNRYARRKEVEEKLRKCAAEAEQAKKELQNECFTLQLKLKHSNLQLTAHTAESPLSLRLNEANLALERLVGEKEDLITVNTLLKEEKLELKRRVREQSDTIEELKSRIHALSVKVTDGGVDNLNAMFAAERDAWLKEKETLRMALAQKFAGNTGSFNSYSNSAHILQKYLRAESHRKALVWQKRYLMVSLRCYQEEERQTVVALSRYCPITAPLGRKHPPTAEHRFRVAVCVVKAVSRMQFLVEYRRRSHENTCRLLQRALGSNNSFPHKVENVLELQTLWRRADTASTSSVQPGNISQILVDFNMIQDRIKNTLSTVT